MGEGYPDRFYGETPETMATVLPLLLDAIGEPDVDRAAGSRRPIGPWTHAIRGHGAAKCALDIALHDLVGKVLGLPVHELLGLSGDIPPTDFTIGIDEPAVVAERARRAADFPALKIKVGGPSDLATLRAVREVFAGPIRVDANTGWTREAAVELLPELVDLGVELIEQPFPARAYRDLAWLQERSSLPIVADESCVLPEEGSFGGPSMTHEVLLTGFGVRTAFGTGPDALREGVFDGSPARSPRSHGSTPARTVRTWPRRVAVPSRCGKFWPRWRARRPGWPDYDRARRQPSW